MKFNLSQPTFVILPPAYYAHLAAYRARFYMEPDVTGNAATKCTTRVTNGCVRPLPALKEKVLCTRFWMFISIMFKVWHGTEVGELRGQVNMLFSLLQNQGFNLGNGLQCPPTNSRGSSCS